MGNILNLEQIVETYEKGKTEIQEIAEQLEASPEHSRPKKKERLEVPIWHKSNLTLEEAAAYFGIGINKLREVTNERGCGFVLFIGTKRLIKRARFEEYLYNIDTI